MSGKQGKIEKKQETDIWTATGEGNGASEKRNNGRNKKRNHEEMKRWNELKCQHIIY